MIFWWLTLFQRGNINDKPVFYIRFHDPFIRFVDIIGYNRL